MANDINPLETCTEGHNHSSNTNSDHSQQCSALHNEHICKEEYIQIRARYTYYLFCNNFYLCNNLSILDLLSDYSCIRHENGTLCEDLLERYFPGDLYDNAIAGYESDPNRSC